MGIEILKYLSYGAIGVAIYFGSKTLGILMFHGFMKYKDKRNIITTAEIYKSIKLLGYGQFQIEDVRLLERFMIDMFKNQKQGVKVFSNLLESLERNPEMKNTILDSSNPLNVNLKNKWGKHNDDKSQNRS